MKKLLKYLSPFAPDQSGACGVLYELGGLIVICDAGGCSGNICGFDEPRWFMKKSAIFSAGLRDMDAIMGRDDRLIAKLGKAYDQLGGEFSALIATPVPAVIGTDMKALKRMAEKKLGVPCVTANAIGTRYFDEGEEETWYNLFEEFAFLKDVQSKEEAKDEEETRSEKDFQDREKTILGILGATPLETGYSTAKSLIEYSERAGFTNPVIYGMSSEGLQPYEGLDAIRNAASVSQNIVVSVAGLKTARMLEEKLGVPYKAAYPFIPDKVVEDTTAAVERLIQEKGTEAKEAGLKILVIHTQFAANELRNKIRALDSYKQSESGGFAPEINCATFFMHSADYAETGDMHLSDEDDLWNLVSETNYDLIIADADIERLLKAAHFSGEFVDFPHFAVSGRMNDDSIMFFT